MSSIDTDFDPYAHLIEAENRIALLFGNQHAMGEDIGFLHEQINHCTEVNKSLIEIIQKLHHQVMLLNDRIKELEHGSSRVSQ